MTPKKSTGNFERSDGRKENEMRKMKAKVGIIPNADGSAMWQQGGTIALVAVYGPKVMHPRNQRDASTGQLRCNYNLGSFSVEDRAKPGKNRRAMELDKIIEWALAPIVDLSKFPNQVVDVHIQIIQADAGTRCASINAAAMALAHAGIPMKELVSSVAAGKLDKTLVLDITKEEEHYPDGEGSTDIPVTMTPSGKVTHIQLDGIITPKQLKEVLQMVREASKTIYEIQKKALKNPGELVE